MDCTKCGERTVYIRRYSGQRFCRDHFMEYFEGKVRKTVKDGAMADRGDRVGVAVSGGKDSTVLLHLMAGLADTLDLSLHAIAIDEGIDGYRPLSLEKARAAAEALDVPYHQVSFKDSFGETLDEMVERGEQGCSVCGVLRRRLLNDKAKELGLDSLATGHNLDDQAQAVMMNYLRGDVARLARFGKDSGDDGFVRRIKPLKEMPEREVALYAMLSGMDVSFDECPHVGTSFRLQVREMVNRLEEANPGIKFSIMRGYDTILPRLEGMKGGELKRCSGCGEPSSQDPCMVCGMVGKD